MATLPITIRRAVSDDLSAITAIYNEAVQHGTATFDTEPKSLDDRQAWLAAHDERHPVLVAVAEGQVVAWASITRWSERCAYRDAGETSLYVHTDWRARGVGRQLNGALTAEARRLGYHTLIAQITGGNEASLRLCQSAGYVLVGTLREVGLKFGRRLDVHLLQLLLD